MFDDYNGWTNWATWNVNLWVMNEYDCYATWRRRGGYWTAEKAEKFVRDWYPKGTPDMDSELEYNTVEWDELADAWTAEEEEDGKE